LAPEPPESREGQRFALTPAQAILRKMGLDSVQSPHTRRNYAKALDDLFIFCASQPLSRAGLMEWRVGMLCFGPSSLVQGIAQAALIAQLLTVLSNGSNGNRSTLYPNAPADPEVFRTNVEALHASEIANGRARRP
jgi:hypothetical protein